MYEHVRDGLVFFPFLFSSIAAEHLATEENQEHQHEKVVTIQAGSH